MSCSVWGHVQLARKLKIVIELDGSLPARGREWHTHPALLNSLPFPVVIKSLQLNDQYFWKTADAQPFDSVHLWPVNSKVELYKARQFTFLSHFSQW